ncbi:MAG: hypothetical protein RL016_595 [Actinomycetota bacterium]
MQRDEFARLLTLEASSLLAEVGELDAKTDVVKLVSKLRARGLDPQLVAAVLTQAKLRRRARPKFGEFASTMLFTEDGLEQASRLQVAALHAGRFRDAGIRHVADLGCGIGTESLALASLGIQVSAFERDEIAAAAATFNLASFSNVEVRQADVTEISLDEYDGLFFDPARRELNGPKRAQAKRKFDPEEYSPNFEFVLEQARLKPTGVKLGPGHPHEAIPQDAEAQWISVNGDLVELTLWFGKLARPGIARSALLIGAGQVRELNSAEPTEEPAELGALGAYIYEPDNAVIRSHLVGTLARQLGLNLISPEIAYLSSEVAVESPWLRGFEVIEVLPFDRKQLKAYLREHGIGILEIKKRGSDVVPEQLRKELSLKGENAATLIVTRVGDVHRAIIARPLASAN